MAKKDYYDVLSISRNADEKEIKRAYRKLAKKYHPDTNAGDRRAEQRFKEITEAYDVLGNPEKRKLYDQFGFAAFDGSMGAGTENAAGGSWSGGGWNGFYGTQDGFHEGQRGGTYKEYHFEGGDAESIFEELFGGGFGSRHGGRAKGYSGGEGFGSGFAGSFRSSADTESEITISFEEAVLGCRKRLAFEGNGGKTVEIRIPAGIEEGQSLRLKGKGRARGGSAGDLYLKVHIAEKPGYKREGLDLFYAENIPYTTAALGGEAIFHTFYGDVKCRIPAGTQSGSRIRLKGKGVVSMKDSSVCGDAYVTVQIAVPKKLSPQEKKKLQELEQLRYKNVV